MGKHKEKSKKHKKEKKHKRKERKHSSSSSNSVVSDDEWIEKPSQSTESKRERDDWLSMPSSLFTSSQHERRKAHEEAKRKEKLDDSYNPSKSARELNPYWRDGGDGLPTFKKPNDSKEEKEAYKAKIVNHRSSWRKKTNEEPKEVETTPKFDKEIEENDDVVEILTDRELNALGAKLIKAEIMGDAKLAEELKEKLDSARKLRENKPKMSDNEILLTRTDSKGYTVPLRKQSSDNLEKGRKNKKQKMETHADGERIRYFADDDKYSLKEMFEQEKFNSVEEQNMEFIKMSSKVRPNDDMADVFTDKIRQQQSTSKNDEKLRHRAIGEQERIVRSVDNCTRCIQSQNFAKHLLIAVENSFYLSVPKHEPLTEGHCILQPIKHVICATQLDENEWSDFMQLRKHLTQLFQRDDDEDCIFFEYAMQFNQFPHMRIECVPVPREIGDMAPIYFKKAIDESEMEWSMNKKLVSLSGRNVQKAIPKGLSYFSVSFGMQEGYAHVIEDEALFPRNFAQEIIGGMLDLHHSKWRKPKQQSFKEQSERAIEFTKKWSEMLKN